MIKINVGERVKQMRKALKLSQEVVSEVLGIGNSALSMIETGRAKLSERNKNILVQEYNVNPEWLDTGKGEMFNARNNESVFINRRRTDNTLPLQSIPLYSMVEATAGLVPLFSNKSELQPQDYIHIPNMPKCDGAIYVVGDSMYPLIKSGDIVLYKQLNNIEDVFWGDMYLLSIDIEGDEYIAVKYVQKASDPNRIKLVSQNPHHADKEVAVEDIKAIAMVKASIRMNSIV